MSSWPLPESYQVSRRCESSGAAQLDRFGGEGHARSDETCERIELWVQLRLIDDECFDMRQPLFYFVRGLPVGFHEGVLPGDDIAPLPSLNFLDEGKNAMKISPDLTAMEHLRRIGNELGRVAVGDESDAQQQRHQEGNGNFDFSFKAQLHDVRS